MKTEAPTIRKYKHPNGDFYVRMSDLQDALQFQIELGKESIGQETGIDDLEGIVRGMEVALDWIKLIKW